ncbi:UDP-N-acetylmuramate:L-alanyl-gamma-D-glutamyl-meso-diaminopimelate ligase [Candidatus Venteria ishoeyi]|uniref:UDP-N-acetylmuramate:L-alanyl-gamma-D-glutamyl- meso-diaminopimelate ligase n=1 Tax=Candidatus Venteria ishoeyi TaxID=1899563 RepID=UPI0025A5D867|nr:UDP-N-acetylmuramate:L-alanyl-gamma-D-glutamyl-meso-diaminopimelate ligase [Candidatus Venteria ishoeyi]MDM8545515.1 UDP-N-acetylmuramate:L-alanyl-gamma-D-glutamyl-meso-diaminopimelate ligase [Candidatus Venteria ishoeyi]
MHIHILGICGTFMGSLAVLAKQMGHHVSGSDANVYPPMSTQLEQQGIVCVEGYNASQLEPEPDMVVIGNALSRGNPAVEAVLNQGLAYTSGAQWLAEQVLAKRWVLAVAGTHGKTTSSSMLAWILEDAGLNPGFLIGGVPQNFNISARLGDSPFFVVEADEYDTAFFDKRSKFVHYHPHTLVCNNLEYDHADIFPDLAAIQRQFHHLIRTVPGNGKILYLQQNSLKSVLEQGCWSDTEILNDSETGWLSHSLNADGSHFQVFFAGQLQGEVHSVLPGKHNQHNALAAIAAARHAGVPTAIACEALGQFKGVRRRLELRGEINQIRIYDDFAHHPTAIAETLVALRARVGSKRIIAVLEPRSNTMKLGVHRDKLAASLQVADLVRVYQPAEQNWEFPGEHLPIAQFHQIEDLLAHLLSELQPDDQVLIMSNGGFGNLHQRLLDALTEERNIF